MKGPLPEAVKELLAAAPVCRLERAWELFRRKFPQGQAIGWPVRHSLALRISDWTEWGLVHPLGYQPR